MKRRHFLQSSLLLSSAGLTGCRLPEKLPFGDQNNHRLSVEHKPPPGATPRGLQPGYRLSYLSCKVRGNFAAMTFDDGPHALLTPRLLDMLKEWNIKATFYLVGQNANAYPNLVSRIVNDGHELGNHSWNHPKLSSMSDNRVQEQLRRTHDAIIKGGGVAPLTFRPPYGAITARQKEWIAAEFGYPTILWSVDTNDWKDRNSDIVARRILNDTGSGSIILAHDIHPTSVAAMPAALPVLRDRGVQFLTVSKLIATETGAGASSPLAANTPATLFSPGAF